MSAPDMAEVERLMGEFADAVWVSDGRGPDVTAARTTLIDYVRGVMAERDQFRDAAKMVPAASDPDPLHLSRILHELAGAASMCWTPKPSTAVFDSQLAIAFVEQAIAEIRQRMQMMSAAPQPVGEVPMPDDIALVLHQYKLAVQVADSALNTARGQLEAREALRSTESAVLRQLRTYGDAREAAGYAAGVAANVQIAQKYGRADESTAQQIAQEIAALRGEVK